MPWGYRSKPSYRSGGSTTAWNTAGETASLRNACAQYDLTEEQVRKADPPISCQWRSCHGNSYAVVKLSDMAALKKRLAQQAQEEKKRALIEKLGEEGYKAKVEADAAATEATRVREETARSLVKSLEAAVEASGSGIAPTLEGMAIGKTAAKNEWYVKPDELDSLSPVDPSKKLNKYHLADVIRLAHGKRTTGFGRGDQHISIRVKAFPARQRLYARYLHDIFEGERSKATALALDDNDAIAQAAYDAVRGKISRAVKSKSDEVRRAQAELVVEENRLVAFDELVEDGSVKSDNNNNNGGGKSKRSAVSTTAKKATHASTGIVDENTENDSKKPAVKKQKTTTKKKTNTTDVDYEELAYQNGRSSRRRNNKPVSYAEANIEDDEET
ncbi:hypothetical protein ACHAXR_010163 [Thalassiosira sp. AJA248-18]